MKEEVIWKPNPGPQTFALTLKPEEFFEIGYGGKRGGGKTAGGMSWLLKDKDHPLLRALIIRRNSDDLKDWIDRAERLYEPLGAIKKGTPPSFYWPKGSVFRTGHLKDKNAYSKYIGHEYQRMLVEELNLIPTLENYQKLISSCRSTIPELRPQVFSTFNPSDIGFTWLKKYWRLAGIPQKPIITVDEKSGLTRIFVPAGLKDNPYLDQDPQYNAFLNSLPDGLREAWRDGSWDLPIVKGAYYTLELNQAEKEQRIKLIPYDPRLKIHTVWDLGINKKDDGAMAIGFFQRTSKEISLINCYQNNNYGLDHYIAKLDELRQKFSYRYGLHFAPHDAKKKEIGTGLTVKQTASKLGLKFTDIPKIGITDGILKVRLMWPRFYINKPYCEQFLSAIRNHRREWDENLLKFKDEAIRDWTCHYADVLRYAAQVEEKMTNEDNVMSIRAAIDTAEIKHKDLDPYD